METEVKVITIHIIAAIIASYLAFILSNGSIAGIGKNEALAVLVGVVILYLSGQASERLLGKEEIGGWKGWLWSGIVPFIFVWFMVWTMLLNLVK